MKQSHKKWQCGKTKGLQGFIIEISTKKISWLSDLIIATIKEVL
jgi:hypothetical protein